MRVASTRILFSALALIAAGTALEAQQPRRAAPTAQLAPGGLGALRGVIYDSLVRAPLAGARVWLNGSSQIATTDDGGRFRLDSVPTGPQVLVFESDDLDSVGLSNNARRVTILSGRPTIVELAVPSLATMRRSACSARVMPVGRDSGLIFGAVFDAERGTRLAGARVAAMWTTAGRGPDGQVAVGRPQVDVLTDSLGNYYLCGVPTEYVINLVGIAGRTQSGLTEMLLGRRGMARRDISISRDTATTTSDSTGRRGRATLIGTVLDENDRPRPSARASVDDAASGEVMTNESGRFVLTGLPAGSQMLMVRMIGYSAARQPVLLHNGDTTVVSVRVRALTVLDTIRVTASNHMNQILLDELAERRRQAYGYFLPAEEVKHRPSMRAVFQGLPSLSVQGNSVFQFQLFTIGSINVGSGRFAPVNIFVDGLPTNTDAVQSYRPDQLIGVEWFPRGRDAPMRFQSVANPDGGVLLLWTRFIR